MSGGEGAKAEPNSSVDQLARAVIGAAIEAHRHLGPGFLESVHKAAMAIELGLREVAFERQLDGGEPYLACLASWRFKCAFAVKYSLTGWMRLHTMPSRGGAVR